MKFYLLFLINLLIQLSNVSGQMNPVYSIFDCDYNGSPGLDPDGKCTLPAQAGFTEIGDSAFENEADLKFIDFNGNPITEISWGAFMGTSLQSITFPSSLISIDMEAFQGVTTLTSVTFDENSQAFLEIGERAFKGTSLATVDLSKTELTGTDYKYGMPGNFYVDSDGNIITKAGIGKGAFENTPLVSVFFPSTIKHIEDTAFKNTKLTSIDLSSTQLTDIDFYKQQDLLNKQGTLLGIGISAFENTPLTSVLFPSTIKSIYSAFKNTNLTFIDLSSTQLTYIGENAFEDCSLLTSVEFPSTLEDIGERAFKNTKLTFIDLSGTQLEEIRESTFEDCSLLTSVEFPSTLEEIAVKAFYRTSLSSVTFPSLLTSIDSEAFFDIPTLTSITLNEGLESIGVDAFRGSSIQNLTVKSFTNDMNPGAFSFCTKLTDVVFLAPESLTTDGLLADSPVKSCTIPTSAKSFGGHKFSTFGFVCDLTSKCDCDMGYGCELTQAGSLLTASKCSPGSYKDVQDRNACTLCPTGKYMKPDIEGSISSSDCITCPSGTFTDTTGSIACSPPNSGGKEADSEDPVSKSIAIAAVVIGSVSFALVVINFSVNLYNNLPHNNVPNKIPTHEKEMEVEVV